MRHLLAAPALALCACGPGQSRDVEQVAKPFGLTLTGRVVDSAEVFDAASEREMTAKLESLEAATTDQVVVVTVPRLKGHSIEQVALGLGQGWRVGRSAVDNGVVLLLAPNERKVRIEVGYGLEGLLTDERAEQIVQMMLSDFREGDLVGGVQVGVDQVSATLRSNTRRPQYRNGAREKAAA